MIFKRNPIVKTQIKYRIAAEFNTISQEKRWFLEYADFAIYKDGTEKLRFKENVWRASGGMVYGTRYFDTLAEAEKSQRSMSIIHAWERVN